MKWPLVLTGFGAVAVVAAIIVNDADSPDEMLIAPPDLVPGIFAPTAGGSKSSAASRDEEVTLAEEPAFDVIRIAPDGHAVIAGQAAPGSRVMVFSDETLLGSVLADARGEWVFLPPAPLQPGEHRLGLTAQAPDRPVMSSDQRMVVIVPELERHYVGSAAQLRDERVAIKVLPSSHSAVTVSQELSKPDSKDLFSGDSPDRGMNSR